MKKDGKSYGMLTLIWVVMLAICFLAVFFITPANPLCIILVGFGIYGAVKLTKMLDGEYEYILTNGEIDIDVITAKSDRKRIITFNCADIERIEKYNVQKPLSEREKFEKSGIYCNKDDSNAYSVVIKHKTLGTCCVTMDIPVKMQEKMLPFMNKLVARDAFKN
jgi:hypothetical protein